MWISESYVRDYKNSSFSVKSVYKWGDKTVRDGTNIYQTENLRFFSH